jgi:hypothetical protein
MCYRLVGFYFRFLFIKATQQELMSSWNEALHPAPFMLVGEQHALNIAKVPFHHLNTVVKMDH